MTPPRGELPRSSGSGAHSDRAAERARSRRTEGARRRRIFRLALALAAATVAALLATASARAAEAPARAAPDLSFRPPHAGGAHGGDTDCAACHTPDGWRVFGFAHERTGFPLEGRHRDAPCKGCHESGTFADPLPRACSACHRDVHLGRLGQRCQDCHEPVAWGAPSFGPDAHRRTAFPLTGRHALVPCESCHGDRRDRGFARPTVRCAGCHEADLLRARGGGAAVDHQAAGFPDDCRGCHSTWRFSPAHLPAHDACFSIRSGAHAGIRCRDCHTTFPAVDYGQPFACSTDTANCLRCHGGVDGEHRDVPGYQRVNRKCYECHMFASRGADLRQGGSR